MPPQDDRPTFENDRQPLGPAGKHLRPPVHVTVLWHPDIDRVGEVAILEPGPVLLSRHELLFGPVDGGEARSLETFMVSRAPIRFDVGPTTVTLEDVGRTKVHVDGTRIDRLPIYFSRETLEREMVLIELNRRVLLGLHAARPVRAARGRHGMIGDSPAMRQLRQSIDRAAAIGYSVLVQGETGSGKELVARAVHAASDRRARRFLPINCGQLRPERIASTLFGHRRGAFTGASETFLGAFRQADGGTLFLDEVGELPAEAQPTLLRALDEGEIMPLGATQTVTVDTRVIAATDADLDARSEDGRFRPALLFRLRRIVIEVPPLRSRPDDIPRLLVHQLRKVLSDRGAEARLDDGRESGWPWIDTRVVAALVRRQWPGNVRELLHFALQLANEGYDVEQVDEGFVAELDRRSSTTVGSVASHTGRGRSGTGGRDAVASVPARRSTGSLARVVPDARKPPTHSDTGPLPTSVDTDAGEVLIGGDGQTYDRDAVEALLDRNGWSVHRAHSRSGIPKTSLGRYARKVLGIVPAGRIPEAIVRKEWARSGHDVARLAWMLRVTERSLKSRLRALRIDYTSPGKPTGSGSGEDGGG